MKYTIYTDGSCRGNGSENAVGAWGYVILNEQEEIFNVEKGIEFNTTNQRMELEAVRQACATMDIIRTLHGVMKDDWSDSITIYTDSAYIHNCYEQKWYLNWRNNGWVNAKKQPVANQDLWKMVIPFFESKCYHFEKVPGHADNKWNNYVDNMVQTATLEAKENVQSSSD